jgi:hypothetical protein
MPRTYRLLVTLLIAVAACGGTARADVDRGIESGQQARVNTAVYRIQVPLLLKNFWYGIHGRVVNLGAPVADTPLMLRLCQAGSCSTAATAITDADGRYRFVGVPGLVAGQTYYVWWGPNGTDPRYLSNWYGPDITVYLAGMVVSGGEFDVADIALVSPGSGTSVTLPAAFAWQRRGIVGDSYLWILFDPENPSDFYATGQLGDVDNYAVAALPAGAMFGKEYVWSAGVCNGAGGCGEAYWVHFVTFLQAGTADAGHPVATSRRVEWGSQTRQRP